MSPRWLTGVEDCVILSYLFPGERPRPAKPGRYGGAETFGSRRMNVETILRTKGRNVATIEPGATVEQAVDRLDRLGIGALVVSADGERVEGIVSERDIVAALAHFGGDLLSLPVSRIMTPGVVTCEPSETVSELMAEMTSRRMRHFPVVQDGVLSGIVSIGDLVKSRLDEVEFEAHSLRSFIATA